MISEERLQELDAMYGPGENQARHALIEELIASVREMRELLQALDREHFRCGACDNGEPHLGDQNCWVEQIRCVLGDER